MSSIKPHRHNKTFSFLPRYFTYFSIVRWFSLFRLRRMVCSLVNGRDTFHFYFRILVVGGGDGNER